MARNKRSIDADLQSLYAQVPQVNCKGLCHFSCTAIDPTNRERERIAAAGVELPAAEEMKRLAQQGAYRCPALTPEKRCSVYEQRPIECRVWGASETLPCPHGCEPVEGELLGPLETADLMMKARLAGGHPRASASRQRSFREALKDPAEQGRMVDVMMEYARTGSNRPGPWVRIVVDKPEDR